jgi:hypothetical protein
VHRIAPTDIGRFRYSNVLCSVGGVAAAWFYCEKFYPEELEKGLTYETAYALAMEDLIFKPLKMSNTFLPFGREREGKAVPHSHDIDGKLDSISLGLEAYLKRTAPCGGVWSTVTDLANYLLLEMNNGVFIRERLIGEKAILERRIPRVLKPENTGHYGLGLNIWEVIRGLDIIYHTGATVGFSGLFSFLPEKEMGIVILTNGNNTPQMGAFLFRFIWAIQLKSLELSFPGLILDAKTWLDVAIAEKKSIIERNRKEIFLELPRWMEELQGHYENDRLGPLQIFKDNEGKYSVRCQYWSSRLGGLLKATQDSLLFINQPAMLFPISVYGDKLQLDTGGDEQYDFIRSEPAVNL